MVRAVANCACCWGTFSWHDFLATFANGAEKIVSTEQRFGGRYYYLTCHLATTTRSTPKCDARQVVAHLGHAYACCGLTSLACGLIIHALGGRPSRLQPLAGKSTTRRHDRAQGLIGQVVGYSGALWINVRTMQAFHLDDISHARKFVLIE